MSNIILLSDRKGVRPSFGYEDELEFACLRSGDQSFNVRARALNEYSVRRFQIVHDEMNDGQTYWLELAWTLARGGVLPMNFTPPREADVDFIEVFFIGPELVITNVGPRKWTSRYTVEEAL